MTGHALVVCETVAAITTHLREVTPETPLNYGGHHPRPKALCGAEIAWDTKLPLTDTRCRGCIQARQGRDYHARSDR